MTPRRIAPQQRTQVPHSATAVSRKDALWGCHPHGKAHFACGPHQRAHSACERWLRRGAIFADLCTLLHTHGRSRDRAGPRVPRRRRPHGPRDARALGPEAHATGAVTQPPTHASSRSLQFFTQKKQARQFMLWPAYTLVTCTRFKFVAFASRGARALACSYSKLSGSTGVPSGSETLPATERLSLFSSSRTATK